MAPESEPQSPLLPDGGGLDAQPQADAPAAGLGDLTINEARLEELLRRFRYKEAQLQTELKNQEVLKARLTELTRELEISEDRAALHQREATANAALAQELTETLRVSAQARAQLAAALDSEHSGAERLREQSRQTQADKAALAAERDRLAAELGGQRQDAVRKEERVASLLKQLDEAGAVDKALEKELRDGLAAKDAEARQAQADKTALAAERDRLEAEFGGQRQDAVQKQERIAGLLKHLDEAERRRDESEQARSRLEESVKALAAAAEGLRTELAAKEAETVKFRALVDGAARESAEAKVESQRRLENAELLQREANEAMDAAVELRSQAHLRLEADRQALEEERRQLTGKAEAATKEASELKSDLRRRVATELAQARAQIDSERAALFAGVEAEREKLRVEAKARAAAEQARLRAFTHALQNVEGMRAEQSAERARILREVHSELSRVETALAPAVQAAPSSPPPSLAAPQPAKPESSSVAQSRGAAPAAERHGASRSWGRPLAWAGAIAAVLLSGWWSWERLAAPGRDYPLPFARPGALAWQGDVLWVADSESQSLRRFRLESGRLREDRSIPLPGARIAGLAASGDVLYLANASANEIQKRRVDDALTLEKSWPLAAQNISALACDGASLFAAFSKPGRIRQYALDEDLSVVNTYFGPPDPAGMAVDGGTLWVADGSSRLLLRYHVDSALSVNDVHAAAGLGPGPLSGFTLRGRAAWLVQDGRALVLERPRWMLEDRPLADVPSEAPSAPVPAAAADSNVPPAVPPAP